jgi:hypothetical protein
LESDSWPCANINKEEARQASSRSNFSNIPSRAGRRSAFVDESAGNGVTRAVGKLESLLATVELKGCLLKALLGERRISGAKTILVTALYKQQESA